MNRRIFALIRVACLAGGVAAGACIINRASSQEATEDDGGGVYDLAKEAKGKIVYLTLKQTDSADGEPFTVFLVNARLATIGGRPLIVGKGHSPADEEGYWYDGMTIGLAWDSVLAFHIMTEKQCEAFVEAAAEAGEAE
jgi:hypothetical protein